MSELLSYENHDIFEVEINNDNFINDLAIESIEITDDEICLIFIGERYVEPKYFIEISLPKRVEISQESIGQYFIAKDHYIKVKYYNRSGIIVKDVTYYALRFKSLERLSEKDGDRNPEYKLTLKKLLQYGV